MPVVRENFDTVQHRYADTFTKAEEAICAGWHIYSIRSLGGDRWEIDLFRYIDP